MNSDLGQNPQADEVCAAAVAQVERCFTDQGWSYPPARIEMAIRLLGTLERYLTDALEHSGRNESWHLDRHFDLVSALTEAANEQQRLYWLLARWAKDCAQEGTLEVGTAVRAAHRFDDARKHATALAAALAEANDYIGRACDRSGPDGTRN